MPPVREGIGQVRRIEDVERAGGGFGVGVGAVAEPGQAGGAARIRVVQIGRRPRAAGAVPPALQFFLGEFDAGAEIVLDATGIEVRAQVQLVGQDGVLLILEGRQVPVDGPAVRIVDVRNGQRRRGAGGGDHERGQQIVLLVLAPARHVGQLELVGEVMLEAERRHLRGHVVVIEAGAVEILAVHPGSQTDLRARRIGRTVAGQADGRHAAVGHVVLLHVQQVEEVAGVRTQAERQRRRDAPALVVDQVATGHVAVLCHHVEAERRAGNAERLVPVGGDALLVVAAHRHGRADGVLQ